MLEAPCDMWVAEKNPRRLMTALIFTECSMEERIGARDGHFCLALFRGSAVEQSLLDVVSGLRLPELCD